MSKLTIKMLTTLLLSIFAIAATAESELFKALDTDKSGTISKSEASVHSELSELFDSLDLDEDGELTYEEFSDAGLEN